MAKITKPVIKSTPVAKAVALIGEAGPVARKARTRQSVLLKVTASKLHELIGDQEIGVSRKELNAIITKTAGADALAKAGL